MSGRTAGRWLQPERPRPARPTRSRSRRTTRGRRTRSGSRRGRKRDRKLATLWILRHSVARFPTLWEDMDGRAKNSNRNWCLAVSNIENDRNPNCFYLPKPNILLKANFSAKSRIQNSTYPVVQICHYSVSAEYSVRYSADYFGRNRFRSDSSQTWMEVNNGTRNARNGNETDEEKTRKQTPKKCQWKNDANGKADSDLMIRQWNQSPPY